jgi:CRISPR-associated protein (TIGR03986 family)
MNPKHSNPTKQGRVAHAPYNFVPLPEQVVQVDYDIPTHDRYTGCTGYIECTLTTLTPIYTRAALDPEFFTHWANNIREMMRNEQARETYAQFFCLDDAYRPVIPGSSLRGMTRALVEITGYGKMRWVTEARLFFRTVDKTAVGKYYRDRMVGKVESGFLLKRGEEYYIKKCRVARIHREWLGGEAAIYDGTIPKWSGKPHQYIPVWVELSANGLLVQRLEYRQVGGLQEGRLIITGNVPGKKKEFVFLLPELDAEEIVVPGELIERFHDEDQITQWQERAFPKDRPQRGCRQRGGALRSDRFLQREGDPVFFLRENGKLTFLGRAQMFRLPYTCSPFDFIPTSLRQHDNKVIDLAEAIFGYVPERERTTSRAGRVYFTDAVCEPGQDNVWLSEQPITPNVLATPKPTTFQHYLVQDRNKKHDPDNKCQLAHYGTPTPDETVIRGHKLYWHKQEGLKTEEVNWVTDTQHTQIRPVKAGVKFCFRIYFENLTDVELGALLWVLDLPEGHHHKIGLGKPLGLGSVAITANLVLTDRSSRYQKLFDGNDWHTAAEHREDDLCQFKSTFERYVLEHMDQAERGNAKMLREVQRIQMLLKMLQYPGPNANTNYMRLEPINEFRNRPVLPDPLSIEQASSPPTQQGGEKLSYQKKHQGRKQRGSN